MLDLCFNQAKGESSSDLLKVTLISTVTDIVRVWFEYGCRHFLMVTNERNSVKKKTQLFICKMLKILNKMMPFKQIIVVDCLNYNIVYQTY